MYKKPKKTRTKRIDFPVGFFFHWDNKKTKINAEEDGASGVSERAYVKVSEAGVDVVLRAADVLHGLDVLSGLLQPVAELLLVLLVQAVVVVGPLQVVAHVLQASSPAALIYH